MNLLHFLRRSAIAPHRLQHFAKLRGVLQRQRTDRTEGIDRGEAMLPAACEKMLCIGVLDAVDAGRGREAGARQEARQVERDHRAARRSYFVALLTTAPVTTGAVSELISPRNFSSSVMSALAT